MEIVLKGVKINYISYGQGKDILLLHGWGQNIEMMKQVGDGLKDDYRITILDLPGFGKSEEPKEAWTLEDYNEMIEEFVEKLKLKDLTIVGHSFGGRIGTIYASKNKLYRLVLLSSPMIKKKSGNGLKQKVLKFLKKVPLLNKTEGFFKKRMGSTDYRNASDMMRKILVNTVNTDLLEYAKKIKCPVFFIGGDNDPMVPLYEVEEIEKSIKNCGVAIYTGMDHYAYLEDLYRTINIIKSFLK